jgi:glutathione S-transferase
LLLANYPVVLREVETKNKPREMLLISPKGTVPIMLFNDSTVIEESIDIMIWVLQRNDPLGLLQSGNSLKLNEMKSIIQRYDDEFVSILKRYKAASRYHDQALIQHRQECERFIQELENALSHTRFLIANKATLVDYALLPFIRQFSRVERKWFASAPYPMLRQWLSTHYNNPLYSKAMAVYPKWLDSGKEFPFGSC